MSRRSSLGAVSLVLALLSGRTAHAQLAGWQTAGPSLPQVNAIAAAPDAPSVVYAAGSVYDVGQSAIFGSIDGGASWTKLFDAPAGDFFVEIFVDPYDSQNIVAGALGNLVADVYRSADGGATWSYGRSVSPYCAPSLASAGSAGAILLACGTQLFASPDLGATWTTLPAPFSEPTQLVAGNGVLLAYGPTGILRGAPDGSSWSPLASAPPACPQINAVRTDPSSASTLWVGTGKLGASGLQCGGVYVSADSGATWGAPALSGFFISDIAVDATSPGRVYASASSLATILPNGGVFASGDHGASWKSTRLPAAGATHLELSVDGKSLYAATSTGAYALRFRRPIVVPER